VPRLPKWDMEQFLEQKSVATCANFPTGRWSALPGRTSIESCTQCELGKYGIKDGAVSEAFCIECPPFLIAQCWVQTPQLIVFAAVAVTGYLGSKVAHPV